MRAFRISRLIVIAAAVLLVAGVALALDLHFHGLLWKVFYNATGEEQPGQQLYGFVQYLGNLTRRQPITDGGAVTGLPANRYGVNTTLEQEAEVAKRDRQLQMIADAGFGWIRQQFRWDDIEIGGRGNFTDTRNDPKGVDAWAKYDNIVDLAAKHNISIIARLGSPPAWSQPPGSNPGFTPPADVQDFVNFATALATRYKGKIHAYQVWNEPNVFPEWGNQAPNPEAYTDMLCRVYHALKGIDPSVTVVSATLAQTVEQSDRNLSDLVYLQRMYSAGAGACFDVLGAQGYGLFSGPTDHRMRQTTINFAHVLWLRDMMVANGDAAKQIWIGEMAWNPVPNDPTIKGWLNYGQVTDEQAARYAVEAYQRIHDQWPFVGVANYWFFKNADDHEKTQSQYYFRLVDPDFTPRPVYNALKDYLTGQGK